MRFVLLALGAALFAGAAPAAPAALPAAVDRPPESAWRTPDPQNVLVIDTSKGRILVELGPAVAPLAAARVRELARAGFYDGRAFFRVIDNFMDQTGDPTDTGAGGSTKPDLAPEFTFRRSSATPMVVVGKTGGVEVGFVGALPVVGQTLDLALLTADNKVNAWGSFCPGVAGMARAEAPGSANSQFFLMRAANGGLDQKYTPFGRVISGMDAVRAIKTGEPPAAPMDTMTRVRVLADLPAAGRPVVRVVDAASPWFAASVARARARLGPDADLPRCDLDFPADIK